MASRKQLIAVNKMIASSDLDRGVHAVTIEMAQGLARRVDAAGGLESAPMEVVKAYLSASKDLQRATGKGEGETGSKPGRGGRELDDLERFMLKHNVGGKS